MFLFEYLILVLLLCICFPMILICFGIIYGCYKYNILSKRRLDNKHVVITGGSSGIGKSLAIEAAKRGANVTIIARNEIKLNSAQMEINTKCSLTTQRIYPLPLDLSGDYKDIHKAFIELEQEMGPVYMLINCAGSAVCGKLEDITADDIKKMFDLNSLGSIYPTKAIIEGMKSRNEGHIVFVASQAAYIGIYGFSAYSSSKFALRGFAESLNMEVQNYGIRVTVGYPPDTDTPGFAEEEKNKPQETRLISDVNGLWKPEKVAEKIMKDALAGYFSSDLGFDGCLLSIVCAGMSPYSSNLQLLLQVTFMSSARIIAVIFQCYFRWIVKKCMTERNKSKKME